MGGSTLDLHRLFIKVTSPGGMERVTADRKWKEVVNAFNFPTTITSGSFVFRKYYLKFLYQMELAYYRQKPNSSIKSTDETMKNLAKLSPDAEEAIDEPQVGYSVQGFIDGKFDSGYLVTMKVGSEELRGVLFHISQTPSQPHQTLETTSPTVPPSSQRRHRKRSRLAADDA